MESVYDDKMNCCGCSACYNSCPQDAITMQADEEGFLYPHIDTARCINCQICRQVCPLLCADHNKSSSLPQVFAAKHRDDTVRASSASGGAFTALSDAILASGGIIYGAAFTTSFKVCHQAAHSATERNKLRISKYVQSDLRKTFTAIRDDLIADKLVLFTGTPCQAAGLRSFIGRLPQRDKLYICDIICYGVPSPLIWDEYLNYLSAKNHSKITDIKFRSKKFAWSRHNCGRALLYETAGKPKLQQTDNKYYSLYFGAKTILRPSCYNCQFTDIHRSSDITIADYWGIEKYMPEFNDSLGVSIILTNSSQGKALLDKASPYLCQHSRPREECLNEQQRLSHPVQCPANRQQFWHDFWIKGFTYILDNYTAINKN